MSKTDFSASEFKERHARVRKAMGKHGIELLLVISPVNIHYLIGARAKSFQKFQCLFFTLEDRPLTFLTRLSEVAECHDMSLADDVRGWNGREAEDPIEAFKRITFEKDFNKLRIGLEVPYYYLSVYDYLKIKCVLGDSLLTEANSLIEDIKLVKSAKEIEYIRKAAEINDEGMQTCMEVIREGITGSEVAAEVYRTLLRLGSGFPVSAMNFGSGEDSCYAHPHPSDRQIKSGDFIHIEFGANYRQYTSTIGRQICLGQPTDRMIELYAIVRNACDVCISEIKAGVSAARPHEAAKRVIADAGMDEFRWHLTGYGIAPGFPPSWGESLLLFDCSHHILEAGMVVSVEPPIFIHEERLGIRLVDNVIVKEKNCEVLSNFSRDLLIA